MAIESGQLRGLRTMGIFLDLNKDLDRKEKLTGKSLDEKEIRQYQYNTDMREVNELKEAVGTLIIRNGRVVAHGAITAMQSRTGRRELTSLQLSPGPLTS